jgi:sporulation and spore germination protein/immunoglobulin-like protein involved in spore germination
MKRLLTLASLAMLGAGGFALAGCGDNAVSLGPAPSGQTTAGSEPTGTGGKALSLEVWFPRNGELVSVKRTQARTRAVATAAIHELLAGPSEPERLTGIRTAVPDGTRLLGIAIHRGVATVDLTSEFESGGGSRSLQMRLGQVVYTLTQFPTVKKVRFRLDGTPVNVVSSEGIVLPHPVARNDYANLLPVIIVSKPDASDRVTSPARVSGSANVFEANVTVQVLDASGHLVGKTFTTATCGTGCRGTYSVPVTFTVDREQRGTIVVSDDDAAGTGKPPHEVRVPVTLEP